MSSFGRYALFALTVIVAAGSAWLGVWQLGRLHDRRARNEAAISQRGLPEVDLRAGSLIPGLAYRRVVVAGEYDPAHELVLRNRLLLGTPGVHVVTPLRIPGRDTAVLVNRGFVPSPDAGPPPPGARYEEPLRATIRGIAMPIPDEGDGAPLTANGRVSWQRLDLSALRSQVPYPIAWYYVIALPDTDRTVHHTVRGSVLPIRVDPPPLDEGPHLSYAIQWFLIGGAALGFGVIFVLRAGKPRAERGPPMASV